MGAGYGPPPGVMSAGKQWCEVVLGANSPPHMHLPLSFLLLNVHCLLITPPSCPAHWPTPLSLKRWPAELVFFYLQIGGLWNGFMFVCMYIHTLYIYIHMCTYIYIYFNEQRKMENSWASEKVHFGCENPFCVSMAASLKSLTIVQVVFSAPPRFPSSRPPREK